MTHPGPEPELGLDYLSGRAPAPLLAEAARLRDEGHGRTISYSKKVFVPLTTMCRDRCTYCTFAKPPGAGGEFLEPETVLQLARAGEARGCTEALFTLGDRPEDRWPAAREFLASHGASTTLEYTRQMTELVNEETALFPHANPGVMDAETIAALRPSNVSMGLMLENISPRLMEAGMPHYQCPDKDPALRVETIEAAGRHRVPFTTGILIGIGETSGEIVESLFAIAELARMHGHIQEVIVQNFRAKADTPMRREAEPLPARTAVIVALARWILGAEANIQVPPNLTERYEVYLEAGINDWGGVSPLTIDWVNPEQPWPHLAELESRTSASGFELKPRLPVYPEFIGPEWLEAGLLEKARATTDPSGWVLMRAMEGAPT